MNTKATDTAFPAPMNAFAAGLTKREYFAALNFAELQRNPDTHRTQKELAELAVSGADALIEALNKQP